MRWNDSPGNDGDDRADPSAVTYLTRYDRSSERTLATKVVEAVATVVGVDPRALDDRLAYHVDPDALNALFRPATDHVESPTAGVCFTFADYRVTIFETDAIAIRPTEAADEPP